MVAPIVFTVDIWVLSAYETGAIRLPE